MNWFRSPVANSLFYGSINAVLRPKYVTRCTTCECVAQILLGFADGLVLVCQILGKHDAFYAHGQLPLRKPVAQLCALAQLHGFVHGRMHAVAAMCCFASLLFDTLSKSLRVFTACAACRYFVLSSAGTFDYHHHILYAWMTGGGPSGAEYTEALVAENCVAQVCSLSSYTRSCVRASTRTGRRLLHRRTLKSSLRAQMQYLTTMTCNLPPTPAPCPMRTDYALYWESDLLGTVQ